MIKFALLIAAIGAICFGGYKIQTHLEETTIKVVSKERLLSVKTDSDGKSSSKYQNFVYSESETYVVEDSLWNWHFTAGTVYARVKQGAECKVTLSGYRFGLLSMYQNIISAECQ